MKKLIKIVIALLTVMSFNSTVLANDKVTHEEIFEIFEDNDLNVFEPVEMKAEDFGFAPFIKTGYRFGVEENPNIKGEHASELYTEEEMENLKYLGARLFISNDQDGLDKLASYYEDLAKESAIFYSHVHKQDGILLQMNGDIDEEIFDEYVELLKDFE